ncbi:VWA domain-containing protein [Arsenicitalea aurantiaca]|uniref:VWA domain-containing protein n=1 Tax=Arsenicitalea aurantiaca TaxID=1783274 RepID=A0A433XKW6_9HYPH|nr:VWA domain-containing protein [Arsenicitalea aurantiaca]RUT34726.1 VWA domain-containing protein [Arsenicitalea aurantiaca]
MTDQGAEDRLRTLRSATPAAPGDAARRQALAAAVSAFDANEDARANRFAGQGSGASGRLRSMLIKARTWIMDTRIPIGAVAASLLLVPLGYQLYATTAMTGSVPDDTGRPAVMLRQVEPASAPQMEIAADSIAAVPAPLADEAAPVTTMRAERSGSSVLRPQEPAAPSMLALPEGAEMKARHFAPGSTPLAGDRLTPFEENRVKVAAEDPVSTFSVDVDTASYAVMRRMIGLGQLPAPGSVRIEEWLNYFSYDYRLPEDAAAPLSPDLIVFPAPWDTRKQLLRIGIRGYEPQDVLDRPSNLVFLVDTSGSMDAPDRLDLLKRAFGLLVEQLSDNDSVSIVAYAGSAGVVLEPTAGTEKATILAAFDRLEAGGATAGADGIALAYELAEGAMVEGGTNRVILATDGDFNVGPDTPDALERLIAEKRAGGVSLSVLGFGQGNLNDAVMQSLAQAGNGNAAYIDSYSEARKVLVEELGGTLVTIASDVKVQVEFNPALVSEYRLIGYETRALMREDFADDRVDAGEIGAGHTVTALYEIVPAGSGAEAIAPLRYGAPLSNTGPADELAHLRIRYKLPGAGESRLIEAPITTDLVVRDPEAVPADALWAAAVAAFGQVMAGTQGVQPMALEDILSLAERSQGEDRGGYRAEFLRLIRDAISISGTAPSRCAVPGERRTCS